MSETNTEQREVVNAEGKVQRDFSILSEDKGLNENYKGSDAEKKEEVKTDTAAAVVTETPEEIEAKRIETESAAAKEKETLEAQRKELNLSETATKEEIEAAVKAKAEIVDDEKGFTETETTATEDGWIGYAKEQGLVITEDTVEAFLEAKSKDFETKLELAKNEVTEEKVLSKYTPEARATLELLNSGLSLEQIQQPFKQLDKFRALDDTQLVRAYLELEHPNWAKDVLDKEMELMPEDKVKHDAQKHRIEIDETETAIKTDFSNRVKTYQDQVVKQTEESKQKQLTSLKTALDKVPVFMDKKVTDSDKQYLLNKADAFIESLKSNPEKLAKALMNDEWHDKGLQYYKAKVVAEVKTENAKTQHNIPKVDTQSSASKVVANTLDSDDKSPLAGFKSLAKQIS